MASKEIEKNKGIVDISDDDEFVADDADMTHKERRRRKRIVRMTKKLFQAIDVLYAGAQNACPYINKTNIGSINSETDIVFDETQPMVCKLDYYAAVGDGEAKPTIILIHGGGFTAGDKKYRKGRAQFFAVNGFNVFCVNYGLAPEYTFPDPLKHIVAAANFVYDNAERFNVDVNRILVDGDSAGGYYAAMLAAFNCSDKLKNALGVELKFRVFGALLNCGVYDIDTVMDVKVPFRLDDGVILSMTGVHINELDTYQYKDVCVPIQLINSDYPPTFVIYSDNDFFCKGQGNVLVDTLKRYGVYFEYFSARYSGSNHCFSLTWKGNDASAANELLLSFAQRLAGDRIKL